METRSHGFGRSCFFLGLIALYGLAAMKVYLAWRDGVWPGWPLGDWLPEPLVRLAFAPRSGTVREVVTWLLSRDVVEWAAAACLGLWLLTPAGDRSGPDDGSKDAIPR